MQKRASRANRLVLFFLADANFWEKHTKKCAIMSIFWEKHAKNCAILCIFVYFLVPIFLGENLVGANFYAFCNYDNDRTWV